MNIQELKETIYNVGINGFSSQYINFGDKVLRISNHSANPDRADYNLFSLVVNNKNQSYSQDRGKLIRDWARSNEWYVDENGNFDENFESIESFLDYNELM